MSLQSSYLVKNVPCYPKFYIQASASSLVYTAPSVVRGPIACLRAIHCSVVTSHVLEYVQSENCVSVSMTSNVILHKTTNKISIKINNRYTYKPFDQYNDHLVISEMLQCTFSVHTIFIQP